MRGNQITLQSTVLFFKKCFQHAVDNTANTLWQKAFTYSFSYMWLGLTAMIGAINFSKINCWKHYSTSRLFDSYVYLGTNGNVLHSCNPWSISAQTQTLNLSYKLAYHPFHWTFSLPSTISMLIFLKAHFIWKYQACNLAAEKKNKYWFDLAWVIC